MSKKLKILLVNPEVPNTFWSLKSALKFVSKKALLPPLGLLGISQERTSGCGGYRVRIGILT